MKKRAILAMASITFALSAQADSVQDRLAKLEAQVGSLATALAEISMAEAERRKAEIDPARKQVSAIHTPMGLLLLAVDDLVPYADGAEVLLRIGNTTSSYLSSVELSMKYGKRPPQWPSSSATAAEFSAWYDENKAWEASLLHHAETITEELPPGYWAKVKIRIPSIPPSSLGHLEFQLDPRQAALRVK